MSAYIGIVSPERAVFFADGAGYNNDGTLLRISGKIETAKTVPFAVTGQGSTALIDPVKTYLCEQADIRGVDFMIDTFMPLFLAEIKERFKNEAVAGAACSFHLVGYSPSKGAFQKHFQTIPEPGRHDLNVVPYELRDLGTSEIRGPDFPPEHLAVLPTCPGEDVDAYVRYFGITIMELMRAQPVPPQHDPDGIMASKVGGHVDMCVVDVDGARIERIHVWPEDEVGKPIKVAA